MKIFLAIPNMGFIATDLMMNVVRWLQAYPLKLYPPQHLQPVSYARNFCVNEFLKTDYEYLWFVDADTIPPLNTLQHLLAFNTEIVTGVTHTMKRDVDGVMKRVAMTLKYDREKGGYIEHIGQGVEPIDTCGMSCCLIHRKLFESINPPWFTLGDWLEVPRGEDFRFCEVVRQAGFQIYAHYDVICGHVKQVTI